jgi:LuxR family maltose regulon positive regulatory protein
VRVVRDQLDERLHAYLQLASSVTLVVAPAGFGKTSLISGYLATREADYCWLSLDERDNDPLRFWRYLLAAIATVSEDVTASAQLCLAAPQTSALETVVTLLVNDLSAYAEPLVIVLDDYHLIEESAIHASLTFFLEHLPAACRLVILSRREPPLPLARLRASGQLLDLRQTDLRFSEVESRNFLQQVMGLAVTEDDINQLEHSMEGWAAGLQMVALALQGKHDSHARIAEVSVHERYVLDYLVEEVLEQQPAQVQTFLLDSSVLQRMSADLCDAVLTRDDSRDVLERLERNNLFIIPLDDRRTWYRYHHLFAELLRHHLTAHQPARAT